MPRGELPAQRTIHHRRGPQELGFGLQETSGSRHFGMGGGFPGADSAAERPEGQAFPSRNLFETIRGLSEFQATASATDFKPMVWTPSRIVEFSKKKPLRITPTGGISQQEIDKLERAEALAKDVEGAQIIIIDHEEASREEKRVQREVNKEFLTNPEAQGTFRRFLTEMVENPDLVSGEYREFILGHETTGNIMSTDDSHSWTNLGLDLDVYDPEGIGLRMGVKGFINGTLRAPESEELRHRLRYAVTQEGSHPHLSDTDSQELIALSFLSHFLRGSVLKGYRGDDLSGSVPRQRGFDMLEQTRQQASVKEEHPEE